MVSVFCLFVTIPVGDDKIDVLEAIYADERKAISEAKKRNSEMKHYRHVEIWNVQQ